MIHGFLTTSHYTYLQSDTVMWVRQMCAGSGQTGSQLQLSYVCHVTRLSRKLHVPSTPSPYQDTLARPRSLRISSCHLIASADGRQSSSVAPLMEFIEHGCWYTPVTWLAVGRQVLTEDIQIGLIFVQDDCVVLDDIIEVPNNLSTQRESQNHFEWSLEAGGQCHQSLRGLGYTPLLNEDELPNRYSLKKDCVIIIKFV